MRHMQVKKNTTWSQEMLDELRAMHEAGASIKAMCQHFGRRPDTIKMHLDRLGLFVIGEGKDWTIDMRQATTELGIRINDLLARMDRERRANDASVHEDGRS
jgi:hypothetical protein